jgi:hypothetical protein
LTVIGTPDVVCIAVLVLELVPPLEREIDVEIDVLVLNSRTVVVPSCVIDTVGKIVVVLEILDVDVL